MTPRRWNTPTSLIPVLNLVVFAAGLHEDCRHEALSLVQIQANRRLRRFERSGGQTAVSNDAKSPEEVFDGLAGKVFLELLMEPFNRSQPQVEAFVLHISSAVGQAISTTTVQPVLVQFTNQLNSILAKLSGSSHSLNTTKAVAAVNAVIVNQSSLLISRSVSLFLENGIDLARQHVAAMSKNVSQTLGGNQDVLGSVAEVAGPAVMVDEPESAGYMRSIPPLANLLGVQTAHCNEVDDDGHHVPKVMRPFHHAVDGIFGVALIQTLNETSSLLRGVVLDGAMTLSQQLVNATGRSLSDVLALSVGKAAGRAANNTEEGFAFGRLLMAVLGPKVNVATEEVLAGKLMSFFNASIDHLMGKIEVAVAGCSPEQESLQSSSGQQPNLPWSGKQFREMGAAMTQELLGGLVVDVLTRMTDVIKQTCGTAASLLSLRIGEAMYGPLAGALSRPFADIVAKNTNNTETGARVGPALAEALASRVDNMTAEALTTTVVDMIGSSLDRITRQVQRAVGGVDGQELSALHGRGLEHKVKLKDALDHIAASIRKHYTK